MARVPKYKKQQGTRILGTRVAGRPAVSVERQRFPLRLPLLPVFRKANIRTLQRVDVSKGISMPEAKNMTTVPGVVTGDSGGYKGGVRLVHQHPQIPPSLKKNTRTVKPPNPAGGPIGKRLKGT